MKKISMSLMALAICAGFTSCGKKAAAGDSADSTKVATEEKADAAATNGNFIAGLAKASNGNPVFLSLTPAEVVIEDALQGKVEVVAGEDDEWMSYNKVTCVEDYGTLNFDIAIKLTAALTEKDLAGKSLRIHAIPLDADGNAIEEQNGENKLYWPNESETEDALKEYLLGKGDSEKHCTVNAQSHIKYNTPREEYTACYQQAYDELQKVKKIKICLFK